MNVRFYGRLADAIGREAEIEVGQDASISDLRDALAAKYPDLAGILSRSRGCIANVLVGDYQRIETANRVEFLPPVCGG